ncbi:MAG: NAD(P)/FAD-dependent oxidoreductase [Ilumatobacter sp.]|uniref:flavin-containing monooxygenase n=1 Tax=Ilumatobacter sp. TaxID=1967498 RepID=UPI003C7807CD
MSTKIVVIGAGHAGLCVVGALQRRGRSCIVIDGADRLGDVWRARYDGLHLNTERDASLVPGTTIPDDVGRWPTGEQWAEHIESAAHQLGVERIHDDVVAVEHAERGEGWVIRLAGAEPIDADTVVVATGRNRVPEAPNWPGLDTTTLDVLHAADYRDPSPFTGRRVLVVGAGNSGTEIAHLLRAADVDVTLSMRTRPVWAKRELFGSNLTEFARMGRRFPDWMVDLSGRLMQPLLFGRMKPYGLGPPQHKLSRVAEASGATLDSGFIEDVKSGRTPVVAALDWIDGRRCVLTDGTTIEVDVVIAGIGYTPALGDTLPDEAVDDGWPVVTTTPFEQAPGLFTAGLNPAKLTAFHPDFITEAEEIAEAICRHSPGGSAETG